MIHGFKAINLNPGIIPEKILFGGNIEKAPVSILNTAWGFRFIMLLRSGLYEKEGFALTWGVQYDEELFVCCPCFINEFFIEKNISFYDHLLRPKYTMHF